MPRPPPSAVQAPTPVHIESPANEFKPPATNADDLGDAVHATQIAEQKGWIRDAYFDFDSVRLRQDARDNLNESATWLEKHPKFNVLVEGHCDERGTERTSKRSAMARIARSIPITTKKRGRRIGARTWS